MATFFDLAVGRWGARFWGRRFPCAIGRGGIGQKRTEGDNVTPVGCFKILDVYQRLDRKRSLALGSDVRLDARWSDDPSDPCYNRLRAADPTFSSERMRRSDQLYDLVAVLDFNSEQVVRGAGSAIFLHVWRAPRYPTAGCVAFEKADLEWILQRWSDRSRVVIRN